MLRVSLFPDWRMLLGGFVASLAGLALSTLALMQAPGLWLGGYIFIHDNLQNIYFEAFSVDFYENE